jgi:hypothetical protein
MSELKNKYLVFSGEVKSINDGDIHFVSAKQVAELHRLGRHEWVSGDELKIDSLYEMHLKYKGVLRPRYDGNYEDLSC